MTYTRAALAALATALLAGCGSTPAKPAATPPPIVVQGNFTLHDPGHWGGAGQTCDASGDSGYSDITNGAQVTVYDASGKLLALGALRQGIVAAFGYCRFAFTVLGVPAGAGPFMVEVAHRGKIAFTVEQAADVELSLGS